MIYLNDFPALRRRKILTDNHRLPVVGATTQGQGIRALLDEAYGRAKALRESRRTDLDAGAHLLLEKETLSPEDFPALIPLQRAPDSS